MTTNHTKCNQKQPEVSTFCNLTEKWKKGKLEAGWYYVKNEFGNIFISEYSEDYDYIGDKVVKDFFTEVSEITEVLAPVPSYEEYMSLVFYKEDLTKACKMRDKIIKKYEDIDDWWKVENQQLNERLLDMMDLLQKSYFYLNAVADGKVKTEHLEQIKTLAVLIDNAIGEKK